MKVELAPKPIERKYPWIGKAKSDGELVLFCGPRTGVRLYHPYNNAAFYSENWREEGFELYNGVVKLSNPL